MDADAVAECFGLGRPVATPAVAACGWGERNRVWRLETTSGVFAIKDVIAALVPEDPVDALRIAASRPRPADSFGGTDAVGSRCELRAG